MRHIFIAVVLLSLCSCAEDKLVDAEGTGIRNNAISFSVISGIANNVETRSQAFDDKDTANLLQPLVLKADELDFPLYLHTYVADEGEAEVNHNVATRSSLVNSVADFVSLNKADGFRLEAYDEASSVEFIPQYAIAKPETDDAAEEVWNTTPAYYWPADDRLLCFYGYAPVSEETGKWLQNPSVDNENKTFSFDYEVPKGTVTDNYYNDAEVQPDIMCAISTCRKSTSIDGKVPMNFRHALSAIKFAVRDVVGGKIERITISGVAGKAHCVYTHDSETDGFEWSDYESPNSSYTQTFDYETTDKTTGDQVLNETMPTKTFLLIPQDISAEAEIQVVFTRHSDSQTFTMKGKILDNEVTRWEPGKEYIYTISTSTSNWNYYFEVLGSEQKKNDDAPSEGVFNDGTKIILNQTVTEGGYYKVRSYRVRANNQMEKEPVAWKITDISDGKTEKPSEDFDFDINVPVLDPDSWIPSKTMEGAGSVEFEKYKLVFHPQVVRTDYEGDHILQNRSEFGTEEKPYDLSLTYETMNTANCYVINAPGYFKFPLVYGNAIKNGATNSSSYRYTAPNTYDNSSTYPALTTFKNYKGNNITGPGISEAKDAVLVWEDAYNVISDVKLNPDDGTYGTVSFKVNREDLQQGNAVIAVRDENGAIMWSWHIWITEHWSQEGTLELSGDILLPAYDSNTVKDNQFQVAPRNLGWCDPKDVWYLKCTGEITFQQDKSEKTVVVPVEQREAKIEYWIGNNTYYQFGRKDPMVGFKDISSVVKYNFGPYPYKLENQTKSIAYSIQNPNILFVGAEPKLEYHDWLSKHYLNLWNNTKKTIITTSPSESNSYMYHYSGVKTVYDPCPVGYMVPPVNFFKKITDGLDKDSYDFLSFNGTKETDGRGQILYKINTATTGMYLILYGTGHRWYADGPDSYEPGENFNPEIAYLWSNQVVLNTTSNYAAYGLALGGSENTSNFRFIGRRSMARPVRPVKEGFEK